MGLRWLGNEGVRRHVMRRQGLPAGGGPLVRPGGAIDPAPNRDSSGEGSVMRWLISLLALAAFGLAAPASAQVLNNVKQRGSLICGVSQGIPGFSSPDDKGNWTGIDVDFCRAIAAAVLNDATKVQFRGLSTKDRFTAVQSGEVDVLSRNSTWTLSRDAALGLNFTAVIYYDGQGFMVHKGLKVNSALE